MFFNYQVIPEFELFKAPSIWQGHVARAKQFSAALADALNKMASEGWRLVTSYKEPFFGITYFTFER